MLRRPPVPSKCEAGSQKCCKDLANTKLDLRNAANSLQIEGNWGCYLGTQPMGGGGGGWRGTKERHTIKISRNV